MGERKEKMKMKRMIIVAVMFLVLVVPVGIATPQEGRGYMVGMMEQLQLDNMDMKNQIQHLEKRIQKLEWEVKALSK